MNATIEHLVLKYAGYLIGRIIYIPSIESYYEITLIGDDDVKIELISGHEKSPEKASLGFAGIVRLVEKWEEVRLRL